MPGIEELAKAVSELPYAKQLPQTMLLKIWKSHFQVVENALKQGKAISTPIGHFTFTEESLDVGTVGKKLTRKPYFQIQERFARAHSFVQNRKLREAPGIPTLKFSELDAATHAGVTRDKIADGLTHIKAMMGKMVHAHQELRLNCGIGMLTIGSTGSVQFMFSRSFAEAVSTSHIVSKRPATAASLGRRQYDPLSETRKEGTIPFRKADGTTRRRPVSARTVFDQISQNKLAGTAKPTKCQRISGQLTNLSGLGNKKPPMTRKSVGQEASAPKPDAGLGGSLVMQGTGISAEPKPSNATAPQPKTKTVEEQVREMEVEVGLRHPDHTVEREPTFQEVYQKKLEEALGDEAPKPKIRVHREKPGAKQIKEDLLRLQEEAEQARRREKQEEEEFLEQQMAEDNAYLENAKQKFENWRARERENARQNMTKVQQEEEARRQAKMSGIGKPWYTECGDIFAKRKDPPSSREKSVAMLHVLDEQIAQQEERARRETEEERAWAEKAISEEQREIQELARIEAAKRRAAQAAQAEVLQRQMMSSSRGEPRTYAYGEGCTDPFANHGDDTAIKARLQAEAKAALEEGWRAKQERDRQEKENELALEGMYIKKIEADKEQLQAEKERRAFQTRRQQLENRRVWTEQMRERRANKL
ncbi:protein of unknown function (DUF4496) [Carpediemonas membranifera]|uniref:CCDC81 HU domain-containing protein n=1 Tax=Carpediemonas membranifera TaxID=201153 RepID=A0A8J6EAH9_9EUKA|nr:protein of unknown function (DUF4496) [Carpediemonas membranifera]|eukprot:KAG9394720.1 protein of unknown function (DUF4496) [Carpediemonas membranifera]